MSEPKVYFQWQNEALLSTIYPLRTLNLRNALEYYEEIDLWKKYKGKKIEAMRQEVEEYHKKKAKVIEEAKRAYHSQLDHFFPYNLEQDPDLNEADPAILAMLKKAKKPNVEFDKYYPKISDPFRQSYFIAQRLEILDKDRKELDQQIIRQARRVDAIRQNDPNHKKLKDEEGKLTALRNAVPLFERQREQLVKLISAFNQIENRRKDFLDRKKQAERNRKKIDAEMPKLESKIAVQGSKLQGLQDEVRRLRSQLEPATDDNYFADPDALTEMAHRFPQADPAFCERVDAIRETLAVLDSRKALEFLQKELTALRAEHTRYRQRSRSKFKEHTLKAYDEVLEQMEAYQSILKDGQKTFGPLEKAVKEKEREINSLQDVLRGLVEKLNEFLEQIKAMEFLRMDVDKYLLEYQPVPPTMKDLINLKLDEYREELLAGDTTGDPFKYQFFLLDKLIKRFKREPERFPRWLQYMIVHFSGMRYASAHGSWADPNDLYRTLQIFLIKNNSLDDEAVADICFQKSAAYTGNTGLKGEREGGTARRARRQADKFWGKIDGHLARIRADDPQERRQGLLSLLLDEETYGIETISDHAALDALEDLRDKELIPTWMWKEISALTDLRLKEAQDKDWEALTEEERRQRAGAVKYSEIINKWKEKYLTGWREEHQVNIQNLVSRAVCNEVAEYILHLRGLEGAAGLTSLSDMYIKAAKKPAGAPEQAGAKSEAAYFVRSKKAEDFRPGAGILWLKYRYDPPPQWNVVKPFKTTDGDKALPELYINGKRWNYKDKDGLFRTRTVTNEKGFSVTIKQYLFWVHIATVAEVAETAEGEVVLTFETSLPSEDRRKACVGVFKRAVHNLAHDGGEDTYNASFVGFLPDKLEGIPKKDLDKMLDWDKVLLKS